MEHVYEIQNIRCNGCANTITKELSKLFKNINVNVDGKRVTVEAETNESIQEGAEMLRKLGYPLVGEDSGIIDKAKSFVSCAIGKFD